MLGNSAMGIIFPNMRDNVLPAITVNRTMASVPYGGRYRLIDFALSSMSNTGIRKVGVIVKQNYQSLMDHIGNGREWDLSRKLDGVTIFPPYSGGSNVYKGKVEALYNIMPYIENSKEEFVIITDCDLVCSINYNDLLEHHIKNKADITVVYQQIEMTETLAKNNTTYEISGGRVTEMLTNDFRIGKRNASMNILVIERKLLIELIKDAYSRGYCMFEREVLSKGLNLIKVMAYEYTGFCLRISDIKSYFDANMALLNPDNLHSLFTKENPVYTKVRDDAPVRYAIGAKVKNSLISDGCRIEGTVENSVLSRGVKIGKGAVVKDCVLLQDTCVGEDVDLQFVVTDKEVKFTNGKSMIGSGSYPVFVAKGSTV